MAKVILKGSERTEVPGARVLAPADATARLEVSVVVRRRARQALQTRVAQLASGNRAAGTLSREEFAEKHGADPADLAAVRKFAAAHGLTVVQEHAARRTVVLPARSSNSTTRSPSNCSNFHIQRAPIGAVSAPSSCRRNWMASVVTWTFRRRARTCSAAAARRSRPLRRRSPAKWYGMMAPTAARAAAASAAFFQRRAGRRARRSSRATARPLP